MPPQPRTSGSRNRGGIEPSRVLLRLRSLWRRAGFVFRHSSERVAGLNASRKRLLANSISNSRFIGKFILFLSKDVDAECFSACGEKKEFKKFEEFKEYKERSQDAGARSQEANLRRGDMANRRGRTLPG